MPSRTRFVTPVKTDFLVIGVGVAGLRAAIAASQWGKVLILHKGPRLESNSEYAQGGIAVALGRGKSLRSHYQDTLAAGRGLCHPKAVQVLVEDGVQQIEALISWGARFDKINGQFAWAREGAHHQERILRARGDRTGSELIRVLVREIKKRKNIEIRHSHFAMDLICDQTQTCHGAWVIDEESGQIKPFFARAVILATGGAGQIYQRTTNPPVATGDGIAMALRAGAPVEDMEFFQFHPTALASPPAPSFLLSEAMRGEGGLLRNMEGKAFMDRYHPEAELAPRDLVTQAIWEEMQHGKLSHVFLDMTGLRPAFIKKRFPSIYGTCLQYGIDITRERIPVGPSAHYLMGGVKTNLQGETAIHGLWAVGETACTGAHGANRLASNSLLEALVFGARAGEALGQAPAVEFDEAVKISSWDTRPPDSTYLPIQNELREIMWKEVGILRSRASLQKAIRKIQTWGPVFTKNDPRRLAMETRNMLWVSAAVIESALRRPESVGAHVRKDFPESKSSPEHQTLHRSDLYKNFHFLAEKARSL